MSESPNLAGTDSKRLLIVSRALEPRGRDRIVVDLCRNLPAHGWEVLLGLTRGARFDDPDRFRAVYEGLPIVVIDGRLGTRRSRIGAIERAIHTTKPDVVLVMRVFDAYEAVIRAKHSGFPCHLVAGVRSYEAPYISDVARYRDSIELVVTSGELIAEACREFCGLPPDRVTSIGGGVHSPLRPAVIRTIRHPVSLLYCGRLEQQQKRIMDLPSLLEELDRRGIAYRLEIAGGGPAEAELRHRLSGRIDSGSVRMHGWLSNDALYERLLPAADVFVHFAAWEGITIAPREAMAHGIVPVISRFTGLKSERQFVDEVNSLTFPVGDVAAAAECIQRLQTEQGLIEKLSKSAAASQTGKYSFEGSIRSWSESLSGCLASPPLMGRAPNIPDRSRGRLAKWKIPAYLEDAVRTWTGRVVQHSGPGSEWPTASGLITSEERQAIDAFAKRFEGGIDVQPRRTTSAEAPVQTS